MSSMIIEIKVPSPGESVSEAEITRWLVANGEWVEKDQEVGEVESEKATLPLIAPESGKISIRVNSGKVQVGSVVASIDTSAKPEKAKKGTKEKTVPVNAKTVSPASVVAVKISSRQPAGSMATEATKAKKKSLTSKTETEYPDVKVSPLAKKIMEENGLDIDDIIKGLKRLGKKEVEMVLGTPGPIAPREKIAVSRNSDKLQISSLRRKLSQRLIAVKNETAMLTTFNEADMTAIMELRKKYQDAFQKKHGVKLGLMSFFVKAATEALRMHPMVNSMIDGENIVIPGYTDISIAVQTEKGLMVPVLRNTETLSIPEIEKKIAALAEKARINRITLDEMAGGTFTITNGGIFGSMMSTPILNPPQSGILGMHKIMERPVAINGKVEIRPMMYLALSYDHRIVDGKDSVNFLVKIKEFIENPTQLLFGNQSAETMLLEL